MVIPNLIYPKPILKVKPFLLLVITANASKLGKCWDDKVDAIKQ